MLSIVLKVKIITHKTSRLRSFRPDNPDQLAFSRHVSRPATKRKPRSVKCTSPVWERWFFFLQFCLHVTTPEINLQHSCGSLHQWFPTFMVRKLLKLNGLSFDLMGIDPNMSTLRLISNQDVLWTQPWLKTVPHLDSVLAQTLTTFGLNLNFKHDPIGTNLTTFRLSLDLKLDL